MATDAELELEEQLQAARKGEEDAAAVAGILCDLANLKLERGDEDEAQALLREAYELRKGAIEAPGGAEGDGDAVSAGDGDGWDASDDWEPDVSGLKAAVEYSSGDADGGSRGGARPEEGGRWVDEQGGGPASSSGGGAKAQVRGRGARRCVDDVDDWNAAKLAAPSARDMPHVVELHGLSRAVTTSDIELFLLDFHWGGLAPSIRWVDDHHALAVFPCKEAADALLEAGRKEYGVRPYYQASAMAHEHPAEELTPPRGARPKTTTAVARRLIGNALGNFAAVRDPQAEKELAALRREKREERRVRQQQQAAAWAD